MEDTLLAIMPYAIVFMAGWLVGIKTTERTPEKSSTLPGGPTLSVSQKP